MNYMYAKMVQNIMLQLCITERRSRHAERWVSGVAARGPVSVRGPGWPNHVQRLVDEIVNNFVGEVRPVQTDRVLIVI